MKINIEAHSEEIADLVQKLQKQQPSLAQFDHVTLDGKKLADLYPREAVSNPHEA